MARDGIRLDLVAPALTEGLLRASPALRGRAALLACELAVARTGLEDPLITTALDALRSDVLARPELRRDVQALVDRLDDAYFTLEEAGDPDSLRRSAEFFRKARAAAAVFFTLAGDLEGTCEGIYESVMSGDDQDAIAGPVGELLRHQGLN